MTENCFSLQELKKQYEKLKQKYNLPEFEKLNEDFEIEKLQEKESDLLLREIRRAAIDRNISYLRFIEMFQNPQQAPLFFLALVKNLDSREKQLLDDIYLELGKFEIKSIALDNNYNENKEAEFIKTFYKDWQKIKEKFGKITQALENSWDKKSDKSNKGYLG